MLEGLFEKKDMDGELVVERVGVGGGAVGVGVGSS